MPSDSHPEQLSRLVSEKVTTKINKLEEVPDDVSTGESCKQPLMSESEPSLTSHFKQICRTDFCHPIN